MPSPWILTHSPSLFQARNSEVRSNAALLFVEAFPIRDPNFNAVDMDSEIQRQFEELYVRIHVVDLLITSALSALVCVLAMSLYLPVPCPQMASFPYVDILPGNLSSPWFLL